MVVLLLSICLWYASIVTTCIAVHFALCHALNIIIIIIIIIIKKQQKISKNRCLVFLNDLFLFCNVILSL